jgi:hypothetical protein
MPASEYSDDSTRSPWLRQRIFMRVSAMRQANAAAEAPAPTIRTSALDAA